MKRINVYSTKLVKEKGGLYDLETKKVESPADAVKIVNEVLQLDEMPKEYFVIATLNTKNEVAGIHVIHIGSLNASVCSPREIFQQAILNNACSIVCFHNHPSGDTSPSQEDIDATKRLVTAGKILGIEVLDHIIIGNGYTSLRGEGYV